MKKEYYSRALKVMMIWLKDGDFVTIEKRAISMVYELNESFFDALINLSAVEPHPVLPDTYRALDALNTITVKDLLKPLKPTVIMRINLEIITPNFARQLLEGNTSNRPIKKSHVHFLANEIKSGRWQVTSETIKIGTDGRLLDGQHRLAAIVEADIPVESFIARDCADTIFKVLDTGKSRNASDVLAMSGKSFYRHQASAARLLIYWQTNFKDRRDLTSNQQILEFVEANDLTEYCAQAMKWYDFDRTFNVIDLTSCYYKFTQTVGKDVAFDFLDRLVRGINLHSQSPIYVLRTKFNQAKQNRLEYGQFERVYLIVKAFNLFLKGSDCDRLIIKHSDGIPPIEVPSLDTV